MRRAINAVFEAMGYTVRRTTDLAKERREASERIAGLERAIEASSVQAADRIAGLEHEIESRGSEPDGGKPHGAYRDFGVLPAGLRPRQLAFMHIGKTAGTSFHHLIRGAMPGALTFNGGPDQYDRMTPEELAPFDLLLGHFSFHHAEKFRPGRYLVTFLRDPVERVVSSYYFLRSWTGYVDESNEEMIRASRELEFAQFLRSDLPQVRAVVENHQTYMVGSDWRAARAEDPDALLEKALANLRSVRFVGLTERYAESIAMLFEDLGFAQAPAVTRMNVTPTRPRSEALPDAVRRLIEDRNRLDIRLYSEACQLFDEQVARASPRRRCRPGAIEEARKLVASGEVEVGRSLLVARAHAEPLNALLRKELGIVWLHHAGGRVSDIVAAEKSFRRLVALAPDDAESHYWLAESLCYQGRVGEAEPMLATAVELLERLPGSHSGLRARIFERYGQSLQANEKLDRAAEYFQRAMDLDPAIANATHDLAGASYSLRGIKRLQAKPAPGRLARWPVRLDEVSDLRAIVFREFVEGTERTPVLTDRSSVLTLGSCFAQNVAIMLSRRGVQAKSIGMGELINSTYANRALLNWLLDEDVESLDEETQGVLRRYYGGEKSEARDLFASADVLVFTLGVAPCFFNRKTGAFHLSYPNTNTLHLLRENVFRTTTVEENVGNIEQIVRAVRKLSPASTIFFTVSPVPLMATFEYPSAILADCVSKSTLRVAIDQVCRANPEGVLYWPSFEIVRWLGVYHGGAYGAEDGTSRHVSEYYIDVIMEAFLARYGEPAMLSAIRA